MISVLDRDGDERGERSEGHGCGEVLSPMKRMLA